MKIESHKKYVFTSQFDTMIGNIYVLINGFIFAVKCNNQFLIL